MSCDREVPPAPARQVGLPPIPGTPEGSPPPTGTKSKGVKRSFLSYVLALGSVWTPRGQTHVCRNRESLPQASVSVGLFPEHLGTGETSVMAVMTSTSSGGGTYFYLH